MKILLRIWHELETFRSWLFDGSPHIDGHLYQDKYLRVEHGDLGRETKYWVISECECGKTSESWMSEMMYLQQKDHLPKRII